MNRLAAFFCVVTMCATSTHGDEAHIAHTTMKMSTLATDVTTYFKGDTKAFNSALAALAQEYPATPPVVSPSERPLQPTPNVFVYIYKGTGPQYFNECVATGSKEQTVIHRVPPVPSEVMSRSKPVFDFDWIVTKSSNVTDRQVSVILFVGGDVDLFDCELPANVAMKIGKSAVMVSVAAKPDFRR